MFQAHFVSAWVLLRCASKIIRHGYNAYLALNLKFEYYLIDYARMTAFYFLYSAEFLCSILLLISALPAIKRSNQMVMEMPNEFNFDFDFTLVYFAFLFCSLPNFISTFNYLHKKRQQQLYSVYGNQKKN